MKGYIYKITNLVNWKCYIGQTTCTPDKRWNDHLKDGNTHCYKIHRALKKYGKCMFSFEVIAEVDRPLREEVWEVLDNLEQYYIEYYDSINYGYNITKGGGGHSSKRSTYLEFDDEELKEVWFGNENHSIANEGCAFASGKRVNLYKPVPIIKEPDSIEEAIYTDLEWFDNLKYYEKYL